MEFSTPGRTVYSAAIYDYLGEKHGELPGTERTLRNYLAYLKASGAASLDEVAHRIGSLAEFRNPSVDRPYKLAFSVGSALYSQESNEDAGAYLDRHSPV